MSVPKQICNFRHKSRSGSDDAEVSTHSDDVDWLDLGPDPDEGRQPKDPRRRYVWYGGAAAVVVALLLTRTQHGTNQAASAPRSPASGVASGSASTSASAAGPAASLSATDPVSSGSFANPTPAITNLPSGVPMRVSSAGHRLLDVPADWELFARGDDTVIRIQLALGRATITAVPRSSSDAPAVFFVGADRAIIRPGDDTPAFVVRDGKTPTDLPQALRQNFQLLPGPDSRHIWADLGSGLALVTLDGKPAGATIDIPVSGSVFSSDGAGYVLLSGPAGGVWYAKPGTVHRITSGVLLASGPTRWLINECDDGLNCATVLIDRASGARHTVNAEMAAYEQNLAISPDGRTVVVPRPSDGISSDGLDLLDLDTGLHRPVDVTPNGSGQPGGPSFVWSPDSRWLFVVNSGRQVAIVNRATGKATPLGMTLPPVLQLGWRSHSG